MCDSRQERWAQWARLMQTSRTAAGERHTAVKERRTAAGERHIAVKERRTAAGERHIVVKERCTAVEEHRAAAEEPRTAGEPRRTVGLARCADLERVAMEPVPFEWRFALPQRAGEQSLNEERVGIAEAVVAD
jgi:hypothetical protein